MIYVGQHTKNNKSKLYLTKFKIPLKGAHFYSPLVNKISFKFNPFYYKMGMVRGLHTETTNQLGYYLAGLIEGDGSILVRKGEREAIAPIIVFTFGKNEIPMYEKLKEIVNYGYINVEKNGICRYAITNPDSVIHIINLVNGKFRTAKIHAL